MKLVVINGPNLNLTGMRSPNVYGTDTLETITEELNGYVISWRFGTCSVPIQSRG